MAMYHIKADSLKSEVVAANFSKAQFTTILKMMRGCSQLRQGKVIESFFGCMLPESFKLVQGEEIEGKYGTYRPLMVEGVN